MSAAWAYELGLLNSVVPAEESDTCVDGWVKDILRCAPLAVRPLCQRGSSDTGVVEPDTEGQGCRVDCLWVCGGPHGTPGYRWVSRR
jgi:hypothetical protein